MAMPINNNTGATGIQIAAPTPGGAGQTPNVQVQRPPQSDPYATFYNDLAQRRNAVEYQSRRGEISTSEKQQLLDRLDLLADKVRVDNTDGGVVSKDWQKYRAELGGIQRDLQSRATDGSIAYQQRGRHLEGWIDQLNRQGKLTDQEAATFKAEVGTLTKPTSPHRPPPPPSESQFDAIERRVRSAAKDGDLNEGKLLKSIDQRMANGLQDGSLGPDDRARLGTELAKLSTSSGEARGRQFQRVDGLIYELQHNAHIDPVKRRSSLQHSIQTSGLSEDDKTRLLAQLSRYSAAELNDFGAQLRTLNIPLKP